ncbi:hypothetical protein [Georgenia sp. SUBG003]|uniref:hypothetical protein n=1 Tax=Georgenia sp. SUBG003 TaxID=1497974 RepID=UPI003AB82DAF
MSSYFPQEMFQLSRGYERRFATTRSFRLWPVSSHSTRVKTLNEEPDWKPEPPPWLSPTLRLTFVAPGSSAEGVPQFVFCTIAWILPVPGSTEDSAILMVDGSSPCRR